MKEPKIRVIICRTHRVPYVEWIHNTVRNFQRIVGGYVEMIPKFKDYIILCNEEGRIRKLPRNPAVADDIRGDCIIVASDGVEFVSLEESHAYKLLEGLKKNYGEN